MTTYAIFVHKANSDVDAYIGMFDCETEKAKQKEQNRLNKELKPFLKKGSIIVLVKQ